MAPYLSFLNSSSKFPSLFHPHLYPSLLPFFFFSFLSYLFLIFSFSFLFLSSKWKWVEFTFDGVCYICFLCYMLAILVLKRTNIAMIFLYIPEIMTKNAIPFTPLYLFFEFQCI